MLHIYVEPIFYEWLCMAQPHTIQHRAHYVLYVHKIDIKYVAVLYTIHHRARNVLYNTSICGSATYYSS